MTDPQYKPVEGGFECACGLEFETPLGFNRHRGMCSAYTDGDDA